MLLVDTNVLIDHLRGRPETVQWMVDHAGMVATSVVSVAELFAGVREVGERQDLEDLLSTLSLIPVTEEIARRGGLYRRNLGRSHGVGLIDAIIAATSEVEGMSLVTHNIKHFPMLKDVEAPHP